MVVTYWRSEGKTSGQFCLNLLLENENQQLTAAKTAPVDSSGTSETLTLVNRDFPSDA